MNSANHSYEKRSVRPYILGLCFIWGLILGFIFYLNSQSFAQYQKDQDEKKHKERELAEKKEREKPKDIAKAPEFQNVKETVGTTIDIDKLIIPIKAETLLLEEKKDQSLRKIPEAVELALNPQWGLTGKTSYRPVKPVKLVKPAPPVDFSARPSSLNPKKPVNINNVELPELSD